MDERASGRRMGRIVGALDDLAVLVCAYREAEVGGDIHLHNKLHALMGQIEGARALAEFCAGHINARKEKDS